MLIYKIEWFEGGNPVGDGSSLSLEGMFKVSRGAESHDVWCAALRAATALEIIGAPGGRLELTFVCDPDACHEDKVAG